MKKMLVIIFILLIIFIGIYINKKNIGNETVTATEVNNIEQYISKIYMWQEVTEEALPKFNNINDAPDLWLWEVVKKNLDNYEVSYDEIEQKAKEIFGEEFTKQFPKEGTEYIQYNDELKKYVATGVGLDTLDDSFFIKQITKTKNGYEVEIAEYLEDYENSMNIEDEKFDIHKNNFIIWNNKLKESIEINKFGSSLDILPTILNLFGINYDSRILIGKDLLSNEDGLVIYNDRSFITDKGKYNSVTNTFIPFVNNVDNNYVEKTNEIVNNKFIISKLILERDYYRKIYKIKATSK